MSLSPSALRIQKVLDHTPQELIQMTKGKVVTVK
jgi:hypothetical protein